MERTALLTMVVVTGWLLCGHAGAPSFGGVPAAAAQTPSLTVTPSSGPPGTGVQVRGTGFRPGIVVAVDFGGDANSISGNRVDQNRMVDINGTFMTSFSVFDPGWAGCTICPIKVSDQAHQSSNPANPNNSPILAKETFTFTGAPAPTRTPAPTAPTIACTGQAPSFPSQLVQGQAATFVAWGFEPGAAVTISVTRGPTVTVNASATCQVSQLLSTSTSDPPGSYVITATGPKAGGGSQTATATFTLVAASAPAGGSGGGSSQTVPGGQTTNPNQPRSPAGPPGGSQTNPLPPPAQGGETAANPGQGTNQVADPVQNPADGNPTGPAALAGAPTSGDVAVINPQASGGPPPTDDSEASPIPPDIAQAIMVDLDSLSFIDEDRLDLIALAFLVDTAVEAGGGPESTACALRELRDPNVGDANSVGRLNACLQDLQAAAAAIGGNQATINFVAVEACARHLGFPNRASNADELAQLAQLVAGCYRYVEQQRAAGGLLTPTNPGHATRSA